MNTNPWEYFETQYSNCTTCPLHENREETILSDAHLPAPLLVLGPAPIVEDESKHLAWSANETIDLQYALEAFAIPEESYHLSNLLKCPLHRHTIGQMPADFSGLRLEDARACRVHLHQEFSFVQAKVILLLGEEAYRFFTADLERSIEQIRGQWIQKGKFWIIASYYPDKNTLVGEKRKLFWQDIKAVRKKLEELGQVSAMKV